MASLLSRLGRFSYRRRGTVIAAWAVLLVIVAVAASTLSGPTSDSFTIPGTESQEAMDLLDERLPQANAGHASARVVLTAPEGQSISDPSMRTAVDNALQTIGGYPNVASVTDPFASGSISADGRTALASVNYSVPAREIENSDRDLLETALTELETQGIDSAVGGSAASGHASAGHTSEVIGMLIAAVVLFITFRSLIAAGMPLLMAVVGVAFGVLGIQAATGFFDLSTTTSTLALMLGLAVGIDYALFIISRYRHELLAHQNAEDAIGMAVGTAGSAVVFAGLTVAIALAGLVVVGIPFVAAMGIAAAATVLLAVAVAVTLLPACLGFAGTRVLGRKGLRATDPEAHSTGHSLGERWASFAIRRRGYVIAASIALLATLALPVLDLQLGLPNDGTAAESSQPRQAYDRVSSAFGAGANGPLLVAIDLQGVTNMPAAVDRIASDLEAVPGIAAIGKPFIDSAAGLSTITVTPETGPSDRATESLVHAIRDHADEWQAATGARASVTGETAVAIDVSEKLGGALIPYMVVIVGLAFILLTVVFRSLLIPIKATLGFVLSLLAAFGGVVAVFQWGWLAGAIGLETSGPILSFLPIILIGILFGLAMDYEVFLVSRMREAFASGKHPDDAIREGFQHGAKVVTAAAIIMMAVFSGFVLSDDAIIKSIGFALTLGVFLDAFVVRMTLVPAVLSMLGAHAWKLPKAIDRVLPNVDVEGSSLARPRTRGAGEQTVVSAAGATVRFEA
ncbi:MAG TPA: MMPL family transporter [Tepidiformaceae bacterium]|nr:MMPL family transporter [Tepidiformaceae bacterium]